jgi:hypothetical protein
LRDGAQVLAHAKQALTEGHQSQEGAVPSPHPRVPWGSLATQTSKILGRKQPAGHARQRNLVESWLLIIASWERDLPAAQPPETSEPQGQVSSLTYHGPRRCLGREQGTMVSPLQAALSIGFWWLYFCHRVEWRKCGRLSGTSSWKYLGIWFFVKRTHEQFVLCCW